MAKINLERYKSDLDKLIREGELLYNSMQHCFAPQAFKKQLTNQREDPNDIEIFIASLPSLNNYQAWYSESLVLLQNILPDRVSDFKKLYEIRKGRKDINRESYVIEDALQGLLMTCRGETIVEPKDVLPKFFQQNNIVAAAKRRFATSLFDIKNLLQADLLDSELDAARELNKKGFVRAAGAISGVAIEAHLQEVCDNHKITIKKKKPTINDLAELLKEHEIIEIPEWRKIQHLADLRNICDHKKKNEPNQDTIEELIAGVSKVTKTIF